MAVVFGLAVASAIEGPSSPNSDLSALDYSTSRETLTRSRPVGQPRMTRAIGHALERHVAAKRKISIARRADRPTAFFLAQFKQGTAVFAFDDLLGCGWRFGVQFPQHLILHSRHRSRALSLSVFPL